jgi:hypothetical protein
MQQAPDGAEVGCDGARRSFQYRDHHIQSQKCYRFTAQPFEPKPERRIIKT